MLEDFVDKDEDDVLTLTSSSMSSALFFESLPFVAAWIKGHRTALTSLTDQWYFERRSDMTERCFWAFYNWQFLDRPVVIGAQVSDTSSDRHSEPSDTDSDRLYED